MQKRRPDQALDPEDYVRRTWQGALAVAGPVILLDQVTKSLAESRLADDVVHVVGPLQLALAYNRGMAFGVGEGIAPSLVAVAVLGVLFVLFKKQELLRGPAVIGIGLVLGGALGNLCDRLFRGRGGAVVDFIDLGWWPIFNLADAAVVVGAITLVLWGSRKSDAEVDA